METLPIEIITQILRFLPFGDRQSCSVVCKKWYYALQDPSINSRLACRLDLHDDTEKGFEVANYARSRRISHLTIGDSCSKVQSAEESTFWMDIPNMFEVITTLNVGYLADKELSVKMFNSLTTIFTNIKTVEMYNSFLFEILTDTEKRKELINALRRISHLRIIVEGQNYCNLPQLLNMNLNINCLSVHDKFFYIYKELHKDWITTAIRTKSYAHIGKQLPFNSLIAFCSQLGCTLYSEYCFVNIPELNLSEIVVELRKFPKLIIKYLHVKRHLFSITEDGSSCLHQISTFGVHRLELRSKCYVHNWLSQEFLSSAILECESLRVILCYGKFDKITLCKIFSYCPFTESVHVRYTYNQESLLTKCNVISVKYRTALNGYLKTLFLSTTVQCETEVTFLDLLSVLPRHLQEFSLRDYSERNDSSILMKLNDRCPNIRKLRIDFETESILHNFIGKMDKLEELKLVGCDNNTMGNMSFPCLKKLDLSIRGFISGDNFIKIVEDFQNVKRLDLCYWVGHPKEALKEGLAVLTELEELNLYLTGCVNSTCIETLFSLAPLTTLSLYQRHYDKFNIRVREYQDMHPHVKVIIRPD